MRRTKGKFFVSIVQGNPVTKSDDQWNSRQAKVKKNSFANRTDSAIRTGDERRKFEATKGATRNA